MSLPVTKKYIHYNIFNHKKKLHYSRKAKRKNPEAERERHPPRKHQGAKLKYQKGNYQTLSSDGELFRGETNFRKCPLSGKFGPTNIAGTFGRSRCMFVLSAFYVSRHANVYDVCYACLKATGSMKKLYVECNWCIAGASRSMRRL